MNLLSLVIVSFLIVLIVLIAIEHPKIKRTIQRITLLDAFWIIGAAFALFMAIFIACDVKFDGDNAKLLTTIGMIIAAFIASASVKESISSNKKLKDIDIANEQKSKILFMIYIVNTVTTMYERCIPTTNSKIDLGKIHAHINEANTLWNKLIDDKYFLFIRENGFLDIHTVSRTLHMHYISITNPSPDSIKLNSYFRTELLKYEKEIKPHLEHLLELLEIQRKEFETKDDLKALKDLEKQVENIKNKKRCCKKNTI